MSDCTMTHVRMGIVTTHPDGMPKGYKGGHAARTVCDRPACITAAKRWVRINSGGLPGFYREDPPEVRDRVERRERDYRKQGLVRS